jgi:TolB-like protein
MAGEIFLSYRRSDERHVRRLYNLLKERGVEAWYDAHVGAGEDWRMATSKALEASRIFVLLYSKAASESDDITKELAAATFSKKLIVPVRLENIPPTGPFLYELASRNWIDAFDDTETKMEQLADRLAELARGEAQSLRPPAPEAKARPAASSGRFARWPLALAALAGVVALTAATLAFWPKPQAPTPVAAASQRIAFFGFTATSDDPVARQAAELATERGFVMMSRLRLDFAARADTVGVPPDQRLARAKELGAVYAFSGEVRVADGRMHLPWRLEDVLTRSTLMEEAPLEPVAAASTQPSRTITVAVRSLDCLVANGPSVDRTDRDLFQMVARSCRMPYVPPIPALSVLREHPRRVPGAIYPLERLPVALGVQLGQFPPSDRAAALAEAEAALAEAERRAPDRPSVRYGRAILMGARGEPVADQLAFLDASLLLARNDSDGVGLGNLNYRYAIVLGNVGRNLESAARAREGIAQNVLGAPIQFELARALSYGGNAAEAETAFRDGVSEAPTIPSGEQWRMASVFLGVGGIEAMDSLEDNRSAGTKECWRKISLAKAARSEAGRKAGAAEALRCFENGAQIPLRSAVTAMAALGDPDGAIALASREDNAVILWSGSASALFSPATRPMRDRPGFLPLVKELGLFEYWAASGTRPDLCASAERSVEYCAAIAAEQERRAAPR